MSNEALDELPRKKLNPGHQKLLIAISDFGKNLFAFLAAKCVRHFASLSMIHSTSGAATKRHLRFGPAITFK